MNWNVDAKMALAVLAILVCADAYCYSSGLEYIFGCSMWNLPFMNRGRAVCVWGCWDPPIWVPLTTLLIHVAFLTAAWRAIKRSQSAANAEQEDGFE